MKRRFSGSLNSSSSLLPTHYFRYDAGQKLSQTNSPQSQTDLFFFYPTLMEQMADQEMMECLLTVYRRKYETWGGGSSSPLVLHITLMKSFCPLQYVKNPAFFSTFLTVGAIEVGYHII